MTDEDLEGLLAAVRSSYGGGDGDRGGDVTVGEEDQIGLLSQSGTGFFFFITMIIVFVMIVVY